jgi:RNA polymerase sigma factor (sigma-70 family)
MDSEDLGPSERSPPLNPPRSLSDYLADNGVAKNLKRHIISTAWVPLRLSRQNCEEEADDIYQELCLVALSKAGEGKLNASRANGLTAWLMKTATYLIRSRLRDETRDRQRMVLEGAMSPSAWEEVLAIDMDEDDGLEEVLGAIERLTPRLREVFILRYIEGLKGNPLAEKLGLTTGSAAAMASMAKKQLIDQLRQQKGVAR